MTYLVLAISVILVSRLALILQEQLPLIRSANRELLEIEAAFGPAWIYEAEVDVLCRGIDTARMAHELSMPDTAGKVLDAMFVELDELGEERERGKAKAARRLEP